jgi:hypothetical protein
MASPLFDQYIYICEWIAKQVFFLDPISPLLSSAPPSCLPDMLLSTSPLNSTNSTCATTCTEYMASKCSAFVAMSGSSKQDGRVWEDVGGAPSQRRRWLLRCRSLLFGRNRQRTWRRRFFSSPGMTRGKTEWNLPSTFPPPLCIHWIYRWLTLSVCVLTE